MYDKTGLCRAGSATIRVWEYAKVLCFCQPDRGQIAFALEYIMAINIVNATVISPRNSFIAAAETISFTSSAAATIPYCTSSAFPKTWFSILLAPRFPPACEPPALSVTPTAAVPATSIGARCSQDSFCPYHSASSGFASYG